MIHEPQTAKRVLELMCEAHNSLSASLEVVRLNCPDEEYKEYRKGMAQVLGRLFFLLMNPIYHEHPYLAPADAPAEFTESWNKENRTSESEKNPEDN
jgi:hypothetical protein